MKAQALLQALLELGFLLETQKEQLAPSEWWVPAS
jgi:hypothetical protein